MGYTFDSEQLERVMGLPWDEGAAERKRQTAEAFDDPQAGDCFEEMLSYWMYVVKRTPKRVWWMGSGTKRPFTFPDDAALQSGTPEEFRKKYAYGSIQGYWVDLAGRGRNVEGWYEEGLERRLEHVEAQP